MLRAAGPPAPAALARPGWYAALDSGLIGFDVEAPVVSLQRVVTYHAGPEGNPNATDMDRTASELTFPENWVRETDLVAA